MRPIALITLLAVGLMADARAGQPIWSFSVATTDKLVIDTVSNPMTVKGDRALAMIKGRDDQTVLSLQADDYEVYDDSDRQSNAGVRLAGMVVVADDGVLLETEELWFDPIKTELVAADARAGVALTGAFSCQSKAADHAELQTVMSKASDQGNGYEILARCVGERMEARIRPLS
ncbi:MAG: hypothetical protein R3F18_10220 [Lysobacterales bacterium]|nr:hypothetical protein [Xanthomonadales bacterium]MCB1610310.1 hypothetical protein [Xanthomonadales bacterium]MCP5476303.1 hypothetical protein [Rhodanobacteraceae bacterium]